MRSDLNVCVDLVEGQNDLMVLAKEMFETGDFQCDLVKY